MMFVSHNRKYHVDQMGAIHQIDAKPYVYDSNYVATYDTPEYQRQSDILQALRLGFLIAAHGQNPYSILDFGYGNGAFMKFATRQDACAIYGYDVTGIQIQGCVIKSDYKDPYSVITFWDAFEHIADLSFVKDLKCETIIMSLPYCHFNTQGVSWFAEKYKHRKPDEHLHHFDAPALQNTMLSFGWKMVAKSTHEDIIRKSTHGLSNILSMAFKKC